MNFEVFGKDAEVLPPGEVRSGSPTGAGSAHRWARPPYRLLLARDMARPWDTRRNRQQKPTSRSSSRNQSIADY